MNVNVKYEKVVIKQIEKANDKVNWIFLDRDLEVNALVWLREKGWVKLSPLIGGQRLI